MKWLLSILALVFAVEVHAQPSPINRRAMVISGLASNPFTPQSVPGLKYWWVATDLTNSVMVTNWVDRISSMVFTNGDTTTRPTNYASLGVGSDGGETLTNTSYLGGVSVQSFYCIVLYSNSVVQPTWWSGYSTNGGSSAPALLRFDPTHNQSSADWGYQANNLQFAYSPPVLSANKFICLLVSQNGSTSTCYTNGVQSASVSNSGWFFAPNRLFSLGIFANPLKGYVKEMGIYTNVFTSTQASNLNYYATNTYGYTP